MKQHILFKFILKIERDKDKYFGRCLNLDGVLVEGETESEARTLLKEAIKVHLETLVINDLPIPREIIVSDNSEKAGLSTHSVPDRKGTEELRVAFA